MTEREKKMIEAAGLNEKEFAPDASGQPAALRERIAGLEEALNALLSGETDGE